MPAPAAAPGDLCPVMLFSGKGGVGKTTLAAATAVHLARAGSRVLILSTDPAHNLSDVLATPLSPQPREVLPGLDAMEVDARGMFGQVAEAAAAQGALGTLLRTVSESPGVDEFGAIEVLLQVLERAAHDIVIVDTAPTGHTLRLLMVPQLLEGWFGTLLRLRHSFARAGRLLKRLLPGAQPPPTAQLEQELTGGQQRIAQLRDQLTDPERSQIILVTIAEPMSVLETTRTMAMLEGHGMAVGSIVVNQFQPASTDCAHCERRRAIHQAELADLRRRAPGAAIRVVESLPWKIAGADALARLGDRLWGPVTDRPAK
jgi:arsenite-transporting ATPase